MDDSLEFFLDLTLSSPLGCVDSFPLFETASAFPSPGLQPTSSHQASLHQASSSEVPSGVVDATPAPGTPPPPSNGLGFFSAQFEVTDAPLPEQFVASPSLLPPPPPAAPKKKKTRTRKEPQDTNLGYCCLEGCQEEGGFAIDNREGGRRTYHKHFLRDIREKVEAALQVCLQHDDAGTLSVSDLCWLLVACCLLRPDALWQTMASSETKERKDPWKFLGNSYVWLQKSDLGSRVFYTKGGRPPLSALVAFPKPSEVVETLCRAPGGRTQLQEDCLATLAALDALPADCRDGLAAVSARGFASKVSTERSGKKAFWNVKLDADAIQLALDTALQSAQVLVSTTSSEVQSDASSRLKRVSPDPADGTAFEVYEDCEPPLKRSRVVGNVPPAPSQYSSAQRWTGDYLDYLTEAPGSDCYPTDDPKTSEDDRFENGY